MPRATLHRHLKAQAAKPPATRQRSPRRLSEAQRQAVLDVLHEPRFADQPPAQVYAKRLDEGRYLCSIRTMHRLLPERGGSGEWRMQRPKPVTRWPLMAMPPNVVLDLYSRLVVAWRVDRRENRSRLANRALERLMRAGPQAVAHHG